jgi:drug/metabolite transporter (DMT)-like permease
MSDSGGTAELRRRYVGIALMVGAFSAFALLDATAKYLVAYIGTGLVVFARYAFALVFVGAWLWQQGGASLLITQHAYLQVIRGLLLVVATGMNFLAVSYLQLAQTSAIGFSNPLWVCALSPFLLGERVGPRRLAAVVVGFIGVLIIVRPGTLSFHWAMLASVVAALSTALYQIATRKVGAEDRAITSLFYASLVGAFAAAPIAPIGWVSPDGWQWVLLALCGVFGSAGHFMLAQAHRLAPAPVLAPFSYSQIILMVLLGYIVFGDVPDAMTLAGGGIVIASGLYVLYRERVIAKATRDKGVT